MTDFSHVGLKMLDFKLINSIKHTTTQSLFNHEKLLKKTHIIFKEYQLKTKKDIHFISIGGLFLYTDSLGDAR